MRRGLLRGCLPRWRVVAVWGVRFRASGEEHEERGGDSEGVSFYYFGLLDSRD